MCLRVYKPFSISGQVEDAVSHKTLDIVCIKTYHSLSRDSAHQLKCMGGHFFLGHPTYIHCKNRIVKITNVFVSTL